MDWSDCPDAERIPGKVSGVWLVKGTRIPVKAVLDNAEDFTPEEIATEIYKGLSADQAGGSSPSQGSMPRILLDQNVPRGLRAALAFHEVKSALQMGWDKLANGDLIRAAEAAGLDVWSRRVVTLP